MSEGLRERVRSRTRAREAALRRRLKVGGARGAVRRPFAPSSASTVVGHVADARDQAKRRAHAEVIAALELHTLEAGQGQVGLDLIRSVSELASEVLESEGVTESAARRRAVEEILDDLFGLGPLSPLLADPSVSDILVNGPAEVFVDRFGRLEPADVRFDDAAHLRRTIDRLVAEAGRHVDTRSPTVDCRLPDGTRVNVTLPPVSLVGPTLSIRRFTAQGLGAEDLVRSGVMNEAMGSFLRAAVRGKCNLLISGGAGVGKTTLLNALSAWIPAEERIVTIEDAAELRLKQPHVVAMETRPASAEGGGSITARDLVRNALRMRPDRIIVGECRGAEALDMLQAMNSGHEGGMSTVHANGAREVLQRLEVMVYYAGTEIAPRGVREQLGSTVDLVLHLERFPDGSRVVTELAEVVGYDPVSDGFEIQTLWTHGAAGGGSASPRSHRATGVVPACLEKISRRGESLPEALFGQGSEASP